MNDQDYYVLFRKVLESPENWKGFLATAGNNFGFSVNYLLVIHDRFPGTRAVLTEESWARRFHRPADSGAERIFLSTPEGVDKPHLPISQTVQEEGTDYSVPVWEIRDGETLSAVSSSFFPDEGIADGVANAVDYVFDEYREGVSELSEAAGISAEEGNLLYSFMRDSAVYTVLTRIMREAFPSGLPSFYDDVSSIVTTELLAVSEALEGNPRLEEVLMSMSNSVFHEAVEGVLAPFGSECRRLGLFLTEEEALYPSLTAERRDMEERDREEEERVRREAEEESRRISEEQEREERERQERERQERENGEEDEPSVFEYLGYHFIAAGFISAMEDAEYVNRNLSPANDTGVSGAGYSYDGFYDAAGEPRADIYRCVENGKLYMAGYNAFYEYGGEFIPFGEKTAPKYAGNAPPEQNQSDLLETAVLRYPVTLSSRYRIYDAVRGNTGLNELSDLIKDIYGMGGVASQDFTASTNASGFFVGEERVKFTWAAVARKIEDLVRDGRYLSDPELEGYSKYLEQVERSSSITASLEKEVEVSFTPVFEKKASFPERFSAFIHNVSDSVDERERNIYFDNGYSLFLDMTPEEIERMLNDPNRPDSMGEFLRNLSIHTSNPAFRRIGAAMYSEFESWEPDREGYRRVYTWNYDVGNTVYTGSGNYEIIGITRDDDTGLPLRVTVADPDMPIISTNCSVKDFERLLEDYAPQNSGLVQNSVWVREGESTETEIESGENIDVPVPVPDDSTREVPADRSEGLSSLPPTSDEDDDLDESTLNIEYPDDIESLVSDSMRYKAINVLPDGTLYWVTQGIFTLEELEVFQKALFEHHPDYVRAYVIPRDISLSYSYEDDIQSGDAAFITANEIFSSGYVNAVRREGLEEFLSPELTDGVSPAPDLEPVTDEDNLEGNPPDLSPDESGPNLPDLEPVTGESVSEVPSDAVPPSVYGATVPVQGTAEPVNYRITDTAVRRRTDGEKYSDNIAAIRLLKEIENEGRMATPEEQEILAGYSGWGGLSDSFREGSRRYAELRDLLTDEEFSAARASTNTAFYTPPNVIRAVYRFLSNMGFHGGKILEPACGTGNFFGLLPDEMSDSELYGVELDPLTARIAKQLYQKANIRNSGFEETKLRDNYFDVAVGNVPFGDFGVYDPEYKSRHFLIHDYFFAKAMDKIHPGGFIVFVTSSGTMDKVNTSFREYLAERADLVSAIRLPNNTFTDYAGTTVTSDILFLRKKEYRDRNALLTAKWINVDYVSLYDPANPSVPISERTKSTYPKNEFFEDNYDLQLGTDGVVAGPGGRKMLACIPYSEPEPGAFTWSNNRTLESAVEHISNEDARIRFPYIPYAAPQEEDPGVSRDVEAVPLEDGMSNGAFYVSDERLYLAQNGFLQPFRGSARDTEKLYAAVLLRDRMTALINAQVSPDVSDERLSALRGELNSSYEDFVAKYGRLRDKGNKSLILKDAFGIRTLGLETGGDEGKAIAKADILTKRTQFPTVEIESVDNAQDALTLSLTEKGRVDIEYMKRLCGMEEDEMVSSLGNLIFLNPDSPDDEFADKYIYADEYLSGEVADKLDSARFAAIRNKEFERNVAALEEVQPEPLGPEDIMVQLGSPWIPVKVIESFARQELGVWGIVWRQNLLEPGIEYEPITGYWTVRQPLHANTVLSEGTFGTERMNAFEILDNILNHRSIVVYDYEYDPASGRDVRVKNTEETNAAQSKAEYMKQVFSEWVWQDPQRTRDLCNIYNRKFNSFVPRNYDGSKLRFPGMNPDIVLKPHQRNAVARILYGKNVLLGHAVGAGKTFEIIAGAQESKRLGLSTKNLIVVPNNIISDWANSYYRLYPDANILVATEKDFSKDRRRAFLTRIATGDYDAVIMGQSQFDMIAVGREKQKEYISDEMYELSAAIDKLRIVSNNGSIKRLEASKKKLETKLKKLNDFSAADDMYSFEQLGFDRMFIDEAHYYKNLAVFSRMSEVAGVSQTEAKKSSNLLMKIRYMYEVTGGKGVIFATGTPLTNSITEMYNLQKYLQPDILKKRDIYAFDSWAGAFAEVTESYDISPDGNGFRKTERLSRFHNLPELTSLFKEVADIQTQDVLDLEVPEAVRHNVVVPASQEQLDVIKSFGERAEKIHSGGVDPSEDNMLLITNDGRKLALDQRVYDPSLPEAETTKAGVCADNIYRIWNETAGKKGTQLVFCDLSTPKAKSSSISPGDGGFTDVYSDLKKKFMTKGIPGDEIAFVHDADNTSRKEELDKNVRDGKIRVLIGSTGKLGTGTNVQDRVVAMHHLDCPYRPSDLEQREGRGIRQGNVNGKVDIFVYLSDKTFDSYLYQMVERKQRFIGQVFTNKIPQRAAEDVDERALSFGEIKALVAGNPEIKEKSELEVDVERLKAERKAFLAEKRDLRKSIDETLPKEISDVKRLLACQKEDYNSCREWGSETKEWPFSMTVDGTEYGSLKDAQKALKNALLSIPVKSTKTVPVGSFRGFEVRGRRSVSNSQELYVSVSGKAVYEDKILERDLGHAAGTVVGLTDSIGKRIKENEEKITLLESELETARVQVEKDFPKEDVLARKKKRLKELNERFATLETSPNSEIQEERGAPLRGGVQGYAEYVNSRSAGNRKSLSRGAGFSK